MDVHVGEMTSTVKATEMRTGINPRAIEGKPAKAGSEPASAGFPFIARVFRPVNGGGSPRSEAGAR